MVDFKGRNGFKRKGEWVDLLAVLSLLANEIMLRSLWPSVLVLSAIVAGALAFPLANVFNATHDMAPQVSAAMFKRAVNAPYVFTAFTSRSESNLYVYTSSDGTNWSLLKGPTYTPQNGLIRDPSVILHSE